MHLIDLLIESHLLILAVSPLQAPPSSQQMHAQLLLELHIERLQVRETINFSWSTKGSHFIFIMR